MKFILFLILVGGLAAGGWYTRPGITAHRAMVGALVAQGKIAVPSAAREEEFTDIYVATKYSASADGKTYVNCYGAFTRFLCMKPEAAAPASAPTG